MIALVLSWLALSAAAPLAHAQVASTSSAATALQFQETARGRGRRGRADASQAGPSVTAAQAVPYGGDPRQSADFYAAPNGTVRPPFAIFIHGGGWRIGDRSRVGTKPAWFRAHGWAFASLGYRLLPDAPVETQARDIADGIRALRRDAARLGFDPDRILLSMIACSVQIFGRFGRLCCSMERAMTCRARWPMRALWHSGFMSQPLAPTRFANAHCRRSATSAAGMSANG